MLPRRMTLGGVVDISGTFYGSWRQRINIRNIIYALTCVQRTKQIPQEVLDFYLN